MQLTACTAPGRRTSHETFRLVASPTPLDLKLGRFSGPDFITLAGGPRGKFAEARAAIGEARAAGVAIRETTAAYTISGSSDVPACQPKPLAAH